MLRVLVLDNLSEEGVTLFREAGIETDIKPAHKEQELADIDNRVARLDQGISAVESSIQELGRNKASLEQQIQNRWLIERIIYLFILDRDKQRYEQLRKDLDRKAGDKASLEETKRSFETKRMHLTKKRDSLQASLNNTRKKLLALITSAANNDEQLKRLEKETGDAEERRRKRKRRKEREENIRLNVIFCFFFLRKRRQPRSTQSRSSAASDVYKRQTCHIENIFIRLSFKLGYLLSKISTFHSAWRPANIVSMDGRKDWKNHSLCRRSCWRLESSELASLDYRECCCWRRCPTRRQRVVRPLRPFLLPWFRLPHDSHVRCGHRARGVGEGISQALRAWLAGHCVCRALTAL